MKFILIVVGYVTPAILATIFIELSNKYKIIDTIINNIKKFDSKNSGPVYDFMKTTLSLIFVILGILLFLPLMSIGFIGGAEIGISLFASNYLNALFFIILTTFADIILFIFLKKS